jgi:hypothetical protein
MKNMKHTFAQSWPEIDSKCEKRCVSLNRKSKRTWHLNAELAVSLETEELAEFEAFIPLSQGHQRTQRKEWRRREV